MLGCILCLERWRQFLIGIDFVCLTDHASLIYLHEQARLSRRQARWLDFLGEFSFRFEHVAGRKNIVADALSRIPDPCAATQAARSVISLNDDSFFI